MISECAITIEFQRNRSKYFRKVISLCREFNEFSPGKVNSLRTTCDEIYSKWDQFNFIFWKTIDWKGSTLGYNGCTVGSHADKTRIFYAVQQSRLDHLCAVIGEIKSIRMKYPAKQIMDISATDFMQICN